MTDKDREDGVYLVDGDEIIPLFTENYNVESDGDPETIDVMHETFGKHGIAIVDESVLEPVVLLESHGLRIVEEGN